ncbi:MAG: hypothetical protein ABEJ98_04105, partial [Candidatus Nanohaloarchaea archaeon]
ERKHVYFDQNLVVLPLAFGSPEKETYHRLEDMGDIRAFTREKADIEIDSDPISGLERLKKKVKWAAKHRLRHILSRAVKRMESEQQPIPRDVDRFTTLDRAMQDPSYIRDLQDLSRAENLPLELERDYGRKFSDQKIINVERSIYQANYAVSDALSHPGQEAHMVIGGGHHSHVVERLKELSNRWDVHSIEPETDTVLEE